jgi:hypothetical protein
MSASVDTEETEGVVDSSFVRKDFYLEPPQKGAPVAEWNKWLEADRQAAAQAKRAHTKTLKHAEVPEFLQPKVMAKVNGVYRQSAMVGFVTDGDTSKVEAAVDAEQGKRLTHEGMEANRHVRGTASQARKQRNRKRNRAARFKVH